MKNNFGVITGACALIASLVAMIMVWNKLPSQLPWLYSLPWGDKQLISNYWFVGGVGIAGIVFIINVILARAFSKKDSVIGMVIVWFAVVILAMYLTSVFKVLSLILKF